MPAFNQQTTERETFFIEVILPLNISKTYTYRVPFELNNELAIGKRVVVQFGQSRIYTAIIYHISQTPPSLYEAKYIIEVLDDQPIVTPLQLKLWEWIASYYLCALGEVMQAALPAALKLASETRIVLRQGFEYDKSVLTDKEFLIVDALEIKAELSVNDIIKLLGQKTVFPLLKSLLEKGILHIYEEIAEKYKPRVKTFIKLNPIYNDATNKKTLFETLARAPKQMDALLAYLQLEKQQSNINRTILAENSGAGTTAIKLLIDKEVFIEEDQVIDRLLIDNHETNSFDLSALQKQAFTELNEQFAHKNVVLLHGVTSSGKTELYIRFIEQLIASPNKQVLYLLPEIALTTQTIQRLRNYFGNQVGVYHSRFNDNERAEIWQKVLKNEYRIILGARSAVFLPFSELSLIVIDEEHESSYKQQDPAPRYHARDTAIYLAHIHQAKVLLGSATPSLESYYNTKINKYGFVHLNDRFGGVELPHIDIVSIPEETKKKTMQSHFTSALLNEITNTLTRKEQVILFQNRRGYTPLLLCATCGYTPKCISCDVSLTYHKSSGQLHCHYCGYKQDIISSCAACGSTKIEQKGFGTEKIEDELKLLFPDANIARMDLDSTRKRNSFQSLLNDFENGHIDILVGTQMVAKGLDFSNVTLIGVINADSMLKYPDFRAFEQSFQLLSQVAGRAGRRGKQGNVIIQAYDTTHRVLDQVTRNDYIALFDTEILERRDFHYPPLYRLIRLNLKHKDQVKLNRLAISLAHLLRQQFGSRILGPEVPLVSRIRTYYIQTILIKAEKEGVSAHKLKEALQTTLSNFGADINNKGLYIHIDVDPH